jgi:hypothetical protein
MVTRIAVQRQVADMPEEKEEGALVFGFPVGGMVGVNILDLESWMVGVYILDLECQMWDGVEE